MFNCKKKNIKVTHIFQHNHWKGVVNTLLLVALKYVHKKRKNTLFLLQTQAIPFQLG